MDSAISEPVASKPASFPVLCHRLSCPPPPRPLSGRWPGDSGGGCCPWRALQTCLAEESTIISKAGNRVSSQSSEVYFVITANYLCYFNLCFTSFGEKHPWACFHGIFFSWTHVTWHSISPRRQHVRGPFSAAPPTALRAEEGPRSSLRMQISKGLASAHTQGPRGVFSDYPDLGSSPWAGRPGYSLPGRPEVLGAATQPQEPICSSKTMAHAGSTPGDNGRAGQRHAPGGAWAEFCCLGLRAQAKLTWKRGTPGARGESAVGAVCLLLSPALGHSGFPSVPPLLCPLPVC